MKFLVFFSIVFFTFSIHAKERILSFISEVTVEKDASLLVKETIKVKAEGQNIKRGIYREFPTKYITKQGINFNTTFDIVDVLRDGKKENYHTEKKSNGVRVYFGQSNVFLKNGVYTYILQYKTNRQIGYFEKFDELYWNVTGNGWDFEIEKAIVKITLPNQSNFLKSSAYTGLKNSSEKSYKQTGKTFKTTRILQPKEGLTIAVSFPKRIVYQPTNNEILKEQFKDNRLFILSFLILILAFYFFYKNWKKVGKDPFKHPIYPRFYPPRKMSPVDMRYILKRTIDKKSYGATLVNLAVKGWLTIKKVGKNYTLYKDEKRKKDKISNSELELFNALLSKNNELILKTKNHSIIGMAILKFKEKVKKSHTIIYFKKNITYLWKGILLSILSLGISVFASNSDSSAPLSVWFILWSFGCYVLLKQYIQSIRKNGFFVNLFFTLFVLPFFIGWGLGILGFLSLNLEITLTLTLLIIILNVFFIKLMSAPTAIGQRLSEKINGFKLYLEKAEKLRLDGNHVPEITPEIFEAYLPYAIALDVETAWAKNFVNSLKMNDFNIDTLPKIAWINSDISDISEISSSMASGLSSSISSSSYAPGSSSGSSGGGFSGGGSGGGGGGGW